MKWPKYVRLQRQKVVLNKRLKIPPALNQFNHTLDKNTAAQLFKFMNKYRPESKQEKAKRLREIAQATADGKKTKDQARELLMFWQYVNLIVSTGDQKAYSYQIRSEPLRGARGGKEG